MALFCNKCGQENIDTLNFCGSCGAALFTSPLNEPLCLDIFLENRYKILNHLKAGSMGAVYKAIDTKFETPCAVKELLPPMGDELEKAQAEDWFKREAKLLNKLDHPNLPKVFDYFISDGRYYLVMNYIEGEDLETILETHGEPGLPEEAVIEWAKQILEVLDYLHSQNPPIIYRDLKPGNIMIHKDGRVMLVDFGIARAIRKGSKTAKTAIGTEGYSPIEQCHGKPEARSDLYALGATMHHLLTGIDPIPFQFKPLTEIDPGFSPEMEIFIMKALEDEPQNRFSSAYEMLQILNSREKMKRIKLKSVKTASKPDVIKPDMLLIPGGTFQMGSGTGYTCKTPLHQVTLSAFLMSKYPVTNKEYCAFLNSMGNQNEKDVPWMDIVNDQYCGIRGGPDPGKFRVKMEYEDHPAVYVNWYGAVAYCNWLSEQEGLYPCYGSAENRGEPHVWRARDGYRLPTEAEWEYACRAESDTDYYWGDSINSHYCWYMDNSGGNHHPTGKKKPNKFGLHDMSGNVQEWCNDWFGDYIKATLPNPTGPMLGTNRVLRGGNFFLFPSFCKSASRFQENPLIHDNCFSFRLVRSVE